MNSTPPSPAVAARVFAAGIDDLAMIDRAFRRKWRLRPGRAARSEMSGSGPKTAYALAQNIRTMVGSRDERLPESAQPVCRRLYVGMLTLTVGDEMPFSVTSPHPWRPIFAQVWDIAEASRRVNSLWTNWLRDAFVRSIIVTERHASGAIHYHAVVESEWPLAERDGSWTARLKDFHAELRERLPGYGFGRAELTPLRKTGDALAFYVSKYVGKNLSNREDGDVGKRLVRYSGWGGRQMKPNDFGWASERSAEWRRNMQMAAVVGGYSRDPDTARVELAECYGSRWAYRVTLALARVEPDVSGRTDPLSVRDDVLLVRSALARAELNPEWRRWRSDAEWDEWQADMAAVDVVEPEPCWEQVRMMFDGRLCV